ncbi:MAG: DUF4115 domain-containing protein [Candidatus Eremiobacteraeota bacterium]|nr:DUF4115 domain-containing protein [Candidatus Eremiobacteraeota bacterium]
MSLGDRFRAAREQRGLTLSDVAEQIRIRSVYLAAIEEENWASIGAPVYIRGFLRTYARFLGLDPENAVQEFGASAPAAQVPPKAGSDPGQSGSRSLSPVIWAATTVAAILIAFVIYMAVAPPRHENEQAVTSVSPSPVVMAAQPTQPAASPTPAVVASLGIRLTAPSWLRVTVDGNVSIEGTFPAGTSKTFHGKSALVRVGNAGGVEITVDGRSMGKLGAIGDVAEKRFSL